MPERILVFGTFDGIHPGHEFFLRQAKSRGTVLIVSVARDAHVVTLKSHRPHNHELKRLKAIEALSYVDQAVLSDVHLGSFKILEETQPDLIVLGHDQTHLEQSLLEWMSVTGAYIPMIREKKA